MFSLLISKVVITTLTFLRNTEYLSFCWQFEDGTIRIFILMCYHLGFRQLRMYLPKLCVNSQSTGDRRVSGLYCTLTKGWVELERLIGP